MAFNLGGLKSTFGGAGNGLNVGGLLGGNFNIGGSFNSLDKKKPLPKRPDSELKELYPGGDALTLQYPMDLDNVHYLMFNVQKRFSTVTDEENDPETVTKTYQTIVLPIPINLSDSRSVNWNTTNLGVFGGLGAGQITADQAYRDISNAVKTFGGAAYDNLSSNVGKLYDSISSELKGDTIQAVTNLAIAGGTLKAASSLGLGGLTGAAAALKFGQGLFFAAGKAYNPRMAVLFDNVNFREFSFNYRLIARNEVESNQITAIVRAFQKYMMPSYFGETNSGFNYPMEFNMEFSSSLQKHLFNFQPAVLKNVSVAYNGDTGPAFFGSSNAPLIVDLALNFQETKILTREQSPDEYADAQYEKDLAEFGKE